MSSKFAFAACLQHLEQQQQQPWPLKLSAMCEPRLPVSCVLEQQQQWP